MSFSPSSPRWPSRPGDFACRAAAEDDWQTVHEKAVARWRQLKFGLFIHWGPVSLKGTEIGWSRGNGVPIEEYDSLYKQFNPVKFCADQWAETAQDAGAKYAVLTTKHHDGFCMFDTKQTDYNIVHTPFGRDVTKELAEACRKQGVRFGAYYSVADFHHPQYPHDFYGLNGDAATFHLKAHPNVDRYEQYLRKQVGELIHNYGPLLTVWFDGQLDFDPARGQRVIDFCRSLQPDILVNNRSGGKPDGKGNWFVMPGFGDYDTPEGVIGKMETVRPWETCMTIGQQWAWKPNDRIKSRKECLQMLVKVVCGDGNFLLNVGPMPDGRIEPRQVERLKEMGQWLAKYGESIYGTRGGPFPRADWGGTTYKDNIIYLHLLKPELDSVTLPALDKKIVDHRVLTGGTASVKQNNDSIAVSVPKADRQDVDTIVMLKLDGPITDAKP